jgi:hypothetical protein
LYDSFAEIYQESSSELIVLACDSGSDKSFDFMGAAKVVECIKDTLLALWDKVIFFRERQFSERLRLVTESVSALTALDDVNMPPEGKEKIKRQITEGLSAFFTTGCIIPEIEEKSTFNPRVLMAAEPKLLKGTPEPEPEKPIEVKAELEKEQTKAEKTIELTLEQLSNEQKQALLNELVKTLAHPEESIAEADPASILNDQDPDPDLFGTYEEEF